MFAFNCLKLLVLRLRQGSVNGIQLASPWKNKPAKRKPDRETAQLSARPYCKHHSTRRTSCLPVSDVSSRQHLGSATQRFQVAPRCWLSTFGPRAFSVVGLSVWNSLPERLRDPAHSRDDFVKDALVRIVLKHLARLEVLHDDTLYRLTSYLVYLLTYRVQSELILDNTTRLSLQTW